MTRKKKKYIHEGSYVAEVEIELIEGEHDWAPYLSVQDANRLDNARTALKRKDMKTASKYGAIYKLEPVEQ